MEKKESKKVWRFYTIADYEKEENFLNEMARDGWNLTAVGFCRYIFRRGTPCSALPVALRFGQYQPHPGTQVDDGRGGHVGAPERILHPCHWP